MQWSDITIGSLFRDRGSVVLLSQSIEFESVKMELVEPKVFQLEFRLNHESKHLSVAGKCVQL
jgi:hypothetical protein